MAATQKTLGLQKSLFVCCLFVAASESRKGRGRRIREEKENEIFDYKPSASYMAMTNMCTVEKQSNCCGDGVCSPPESEITCMADCPGVTTHETCGEEPHSDRSGKGLTFGVSFRAVGP